MRLLENERISIERDDGKMQERVLSELIWLDVSMVRSTRELAFASNYDTGADRRG